VPPGIRRKWQIDQSFNRSSCNILGTVFESISWDHGFDSRCHLAKEENGNETTVAKAVA
jgi:hypothetical protein